MTKLEEKLIELGYKYSSCTENYGLRYGKWYDEEKTYKMFFVIDYPNKLQILDWYVFPHVTNFKQKEATNLQLALNQLKQDLEVLKQYEE